jgi:ABC-type bacteriocin/lantibiotic exporter with double-glycine peptidase domain
MTTSPKKLSGFTLHKQETPVSCGPASAKMALEILGIKISESELRKRMKTNIVLGTLYGFLRRTYERCLKENGVNVQVRILSGPSVTSEVLAESLAKGWPVIVSFFTENHSRPGTMVGHYSVVYGIDERAGKVYLANPFGSEDIIDIDRLWKMTEYDLSEGKTPFFMKLSIRLGKFMGIIAPRTIFVVEEG